MKPSSILSVLFLATSAAFAQHPDTKAAFEKPPVAMAPPASDESDAEKAILTAEIAWREAEFKHDIDAVQHLIRTDFIGIDDNGHIWNGRDLIAAFDSGPKPTGPKPQAQALRIRYYGDGTVAIVTGAEAVPGPKGYGDRFCHIWIKSNNAWQLSNSQKTRITEVPPKVTKPIIINPKG